MLIVLLLAKFGVWCGVHVALWFWLRECFEWLIAWLVALHFVGKERLYSEFDTVWHNCVVSDDWECPLGRDNSYAYWKHIVKIQINPVYCNELLFCRCCFWVIICGIRQTCQRKKAWDFHRCNHNTSAQLAAILLLKVILKRWNWLETPLHLACLCNSTGHAVTGRGGVVYLCKSRLLAC